MSDMDQQKNAPIRKALGRMIGVLIIAGAIVVSIIAVWEWQVNPETDDATVRANFIGVAPQVNGHIVELHVRDNQLVQAGDLLFVIDPRPYEIAVERARAALVLTRREVEGLWNALSSAKAGVGKAGAQVGAVSADITRAEAQRVAARAALTRAEGEFTHADDHLKRLEPLLPRQFVTEDQVEQARTTRLTTSMAVEQARTSLRAAEAAVEAARAQRSAALAAHDQSKSDQGRAQDAIGQDGEINARIRAAEAAVKSAELDLSYCHVRAPFTGLVVNLNISVGAFARVGMEVFSLVDTGTWYVVGNFRETQLRHIRQGSAADIYLQSQPNRRFQGTVVGLGWAVLPEYGTSVDGLPKIDRQLDWVRLAQRFPVRLRVDNPDDSFRLGASAVVTVRGDTGPEAPASRRERDR
jgi:membrane fusion protein, multidrug efflux system